ncbi:MAG TPA: helix-turn-helix domain-containing protein [Clostridium perfringens]|nr:helix-turn-helix domain-containing protein [Clostridium perfringens]
MTIGQRLKKKREEMILTQNQLSEKTGISVSSLKNYESDRHEPPITKLVQLSEVLDCGLVWLATGKINDIKENSSQESELINIFKLLNENDKMESLDYIKFRYERSKKNNIN